MAWQPARPDRGAVAWEARDTSRDSAEHADGGHATPVPAVATRRLAARWHRASRARRSALAATSLVATAAVVTGLGLAAAPHYRAGAPVDGIVVDDLRHEPAPTAWSIDPQDDLGLTVAGRCLQYEPAGTVDGDQLVTVRAVFDTSCDIRDPGGQRLARIDAATGRVLWSIDVGTALDVGTGDVKVWPQGGSSALVSIGSYTALNAAAGSYGIGFDEADVDAAVRRNGFAYSEAYAPIDLATGRIGTVRGSTAQTPEQVVAADADVVLVKTESREVIGTNTTIDTDTQESTSMPSFAPPTYTLMRADALDVPLWSGTVADDARPLLFGGRVVFLSESASTALDPATATLSPWGSELGRVGEGGVYDGVLLVYARTTSGDRAVLSGVSPEGDELWSRGFRQGRFPRLAAGCVVFSDRTGTDCVEPTTGDVRWTRPSDEQTSLASVPHDDPVGSRGDVVFVQTFADSSARSASGSSRDRDRDLLAVDGATGAELLRTSVPGESFIAAIGRTVGYVLSDPTPDYAPRTVTAFDLSSGARLWQTRLDAGSFQFWAGSLVSIDADGVVHGNADPVELAAARGAA
ncbi:PQQ-binding-like beta-propeller repeat protein [Frigoribacterium sp. 2-23]|uniref:outer membrane protein assembly factor BamB family protein n=1 Tax=Frigoribacterium sp. 2-23 TaxID=3415006 RepID=UPI003C703AC8